MRHRRWMVLALLASGLVCAGPAHAQDSAAASALYDKGLADMQAGKFDTACPALAESYRLDPLPGALFTLADCEQKAGRFATAVARYDEYLANFSRMTDKEKKGQRGRDKLATSAKEALLPKVPMISFKLPANAPAGTTVRRDGQLMNSPSLGIPLPVDPGEHVLITQVPGAPEKSQRLTFAAGEKKEVELAIELPAAAPSASAPVAAPSTTAPAAPTAAPTSAASTQPVVGGPENKTSSLATAGWVFVGLGVAGLATGGVMGGLALGQKGKVSDNCTGLACNDTGMDAVDKGRTFGLVSTIGFGVGGAALATGVILLLAGGGSRAPAKEARTTSMRPIVAVNPSSGPILGLQGSW